MKVKIFQSWNAYEVQENVNEFLATNIIFIQMLQSEGANSTTITILYKENN
jgi:hypothetical protein